MSHATHVALLIAFTATTSGIAAESPFERELKQLTADRDKSAAVALDPINKRFRVGLEQLLKRATQANALDDAIKIREALGTPAAGAPSAPATVSKTAAHNLQRKLIGTQWTGDGKNYVGELQFIDAKSVKWTKTGGGPTALVSYDIAEDGSVRFKIGPNENTLGFAADFKTLTLNTDSTFTRK